jgi:hypothetical protein
MSSSATTPTTLTASAASWSIKLLDIGYVAVIYFTLGLLLAKIMDAFYGKFSYYKESKKPGYKSALEGLGMLWLNGIILYFVRNIVTLIPFPLDGFYGFEHSQVKELTNSTVFIYSFLYYQQHFQNKMKYLYRLMGPTPPPKPVLTRKQLALIRQQIRLQVQQQNIKDRATMKAVYDAAVSQALGQALSQARNSSIERDNARRRAMQLEQQVLIARMQKEQAVEIARIRAQYTARAAQGAPVAPVPVPSVAPAPTPVI